MQNRSPIEWVTLERSCYDTIVRHARREFPFECCGILLGSRTNLSIEISDVIEAGNITTDDPRSSYQIEWETLFGARRKARTTTRSIVGFYHSHPSGPSAPSERDLTFAWSNHVYAIISIDDSKIDGLTVWYSDSGRFHRLYVKNRQDNHDDPLGT